MNRSAIVFVLGAFAAAGCSAVSQPGLGESDGSSSFGVAENTRQAYGIISFLNSSQATYGVLVQSVGLGTTAAKNISQYIKGPGWQGGKTLVKGSPADPTGDVNPIDSIAELDAIPMVGPKTIKKILGYAQNAGWVPDHYVDGVPLAEADAEVMVDTANFASFDELSGDGELATAAAASLVAKRPFSTVEQLAAAPHVGAVALQHLRSYAEIVDAPWFDADGSSTSVAFQDMTVDAWPVSSDVEDLVASVDSHGNFVPAVADYVATPEDLATAMATPEGQGRLAFDLLFRPGNVTWGTSGTATLVTVARDEAWAELSAHVFVGWEQTPDLDRAALPLRFVVGSILSGFDGPSVSIYRLHWDNSDDTSFEGLVAIDADTGEMRVLSIDFPA